jgi:hypothetical protein
MLLELICHQQAGSTGPYANDVHMSFGVDGTSQTPTGLEIWWSVRWDDEICHFCVFEQN